MVYNMQVSGIHVVLGDPVRLRADLGNKDLRLHLPVLRADQLFISMRLSFVLLQHATQDLRQTHIPVRHVAQVSNILLYQHYIL